jgi:RNA ligase (TIGR02306 family)
MSLASIQRITEIKDIDGADRIQAAKVLGYWTVIKKGEFQVGDLVTWHEPDTLINKENPAYSFLKDARLRVCKFRKQVSQGLALPLSAFGFVEGDKLTANYVNEGDDVTERIGIKKYEKPLASQLAGIARGNFPSWLHKTDEPRLLSSPKAIEELKDKNVYISQKMDGSSATFYLKDGVFGVCSRNLDLKEDEANTFWKVARKYDIEAKMRELGDNCCIQGELCGPGIQGNKAGLTEPTLFLFDIFDIANDKYMGLECLVEFSFAAEIPHVPLIWCNVFNGSIESLQELANEQKYPNGEPCEGIVVRPVLDIHSDYLKRRLSVKIISETFALKNSE